MINKNVESYLATEYEKMSLSDLILISIYFILKNKETCTFERLVAECFQRFPNLFSFKRYPQWPDATKLDRPLRSLRKYGFIVGKPTDKFELTDFGRAKIESIFNNIQNNTYVFKVGTNRSQRSIDDRLIHFIKESDLFVSFLANKKANFSEAKIRELLRCTMETPIRIVKQNLVYLQKLADYYDEPKIKEFLDYCERALIRKNGKNSKD